jgi:hypothetical protein
MADAEKTRLIPPIDPRSPHPTPQISWRRMRGMISIGSRIQIRARQNRALMRPILFSFRLMR